LSQKDVEILFGEGYELQVEKMIGQPGQFKAKERITLIGNKGSMENVAIVGPARNKTQIEILPSDQEKLGIKAPHRISGDIGNTPKIIMKGSNGEVETDGVIIALNHLHLNIKHAEKLNLLNKKTIDVLVEKDNRILSNVPLRYGKDHDAEFHVDRDYANKFNLQNQDLIKIIVDGKIIDLLE